MRKVFGIGFHKTGTKSLANALSILGYRVTGPNFTRDVSQQENLYSRVEGLIPKFDAFQDNPWPIIYRELDHHHPGSKFILTIRPSKNWIRSAVKYFGNETTPMRELIYGAGSPIGHEDIYLEVYERHNVDVLSYFKGRQKDLLVIDITKGDGWQKLCPFLECEIPDCAFPKINTNSEADYEFSDE